jgi:magnesium chelatase family protein
MLGRTKCVALVGVEGRLIEVEADAASGLPAFTIVGLPDAALGESRDRVRAAINNSGLPFTLRRLTVNLQPASLPKTGTTFDLAMLRL